jgi:hypothetical protein
MIDIKNIYFLYRLLNTLTLKIDHIFCVGRLKASDIFYVLSTKNYGTFFYRLKLLINTIKKN